MPQYFAYLVEYAPNYQKCQQNIPTPHLLLHRGTPAFFWKLLTHSRKCLKRFWVVWCFSGYYWYKISWPFITNADWCRSFHSISVTHSQHVNHKHDIYSCGSIFQKFNETSLMLSTNIYRCAIFTTTSSICTIYIFIYALNYARTEVEVVSLVRNGIFSESYIF